MQDLLKNIEINNVTKLEIIKFIDDLLGLKLLENSAGLKDAYVFEVPDEVNKLAIDRENAKKVKNYVLADKIRNDICNLGYVVIDTKEGFVIKLKS